MSERVQGSTGGKGRDADVRVGRSLAERLEEFTTAEGTAQARRDFLRRAGLGGAALALVACGVDPGRITQAAIAAPQGAGGTVGTAAGVTVTLDFSTDVGVLNYAYALEQLEAAFYAQVVGAPGFATIFAANERRVLADVRDHELVHRDFLKAALGSAAIPGLTPNFSAVNFGDRTSVLTTARTFEDLGVGAYNGAGPYLRSGAYLTLAGKIVSVEARHASAIRDLLAPRSPEFAPAPFDTGLAPATVLAAAAPFITDTITVVNA